MTKRIVALVAVLTLVVTMLILPTTAGAVYEVYSNCSNHKPLNVRSGPGKNYPVIGSIAYGDIVPIDHNLDNGWSEIVFGSVPGYVMTSLTSRSKPGSGGSSQGGSSSGDIYKNVKQIKNPYTVVAHGVRGTGSVNVRWAPSMSGKLIQAVPYGTELKAIAETNSWYQVVDPNSNLTGWAMKKFLPRK